MCLTHAQVISFIPWPPNPGAPSPPAVRRPRLRSGNSAPSSQGAPRHLNPHRLGGSHCPVNSGSSQTPGLTPHPGVGGKAPSLFSVPEFWGPAGRRTSSPCSFAPFAPSLQQPESLLDSTADAAGDVRTPSTALPAGGRLRQRSHAGSRARASLRGKETVTLKSCAPFRENLSPVHLGRQRGLLGPGGRVSRRSGGTLYAGAAHPCSCRRPVRRSPPAAAAAAAAGSRSPGCGGGKRH